MLIKRLFLVLAVSLIASLAYATTTIYDSILYNCTIYGQDTSVTENVIYAGEQVVYNGENVVYP